MYTSGHCGSTNSSFFGKESRNPRVYNLSAWQHLKAELWTQEGRPGRVLQFERHGPSVLFCVMKRRTSFSWHGLSMETPSVCSSGSEQMCGAQCSFMVTYCEWTAPLQIFSSALITPTNPVSYMCSVTSSLTAIILQENASMGRERNWNKI